MKQIIINHERPLIYEELHRRFGVEWNEGVIIAWDKKIHCIREIAPQKLVHENVHLIRQEKIGNDAWWKLYLESDIFRLEEEYLAYKAEANFIRRNIPNREHQFQYIRDMAHSLSSEMYGNIITKAEALQLLTKKT